MSKEKIGSLAKIVLILLIKLQVLSCFLGVPCLEKITDNPFAYNDNKDNVKEEISPGTRQTKCNKRREEKNRA